MVLTLVKSYLFCGNKIKFSKSKKNEIFNFDKIIYFYFYAHKLLIRVKQNSILEKHLKEFHKCDSYDE